MTDLGPEPKPITYPRRMSSAQDVSLCILYKEGVERKFRFELGVASSIVAEFRSVLDSKRQKQPRSSAIIIQLQDPPEFVFIVDAESVSTMWISEVFEVST